MKALLDTHVWLWYLLGDARLSTLQRQWIENEQVELWLSPVSLWEAHLVIERRRIPVTGSAARWLEAALRVLPVSEAVLTFPIAIRSRVVELDHPDPADRFIVATALELKMTLLTSDQRLVRCPDLDCVS